MVFINPGATGELFWSLVSQTMQAAAQQLSLDLAIEMAERDRVRMKQLALSSIQSLDPPDVLILVNEEQASAALLEAADADGVKVLMLLNDVAGRDRVHAGELGERPRNWIGSLVYDNYTAGQRLARALGDFAERKGLSVAKGGGGRGERPLVALLGDMITPASIDGIRGLRDAVDEGSQGLVIDHEVMADWNEHRALTLMDRVLQHYVRSGARRPVGIWAANAAMGMGAIRALRQNGMEPGEDVGVVTANWSVEAVEAVESGEMLIVEGGYFFSGAWAMVVLRDYFDGGGIAGGTKQISLETSPLNAENIEEFRKTVGDIIKRRSFGEIDYSRFLVGSDGDVADYDFSIDTLMDVVRTRLRTPG